MGESADITIILKGWDRDRRAALDQLAPLVYAELRKLARSYLARDRQGHTLQPTALVHEAYMRMVEETMPNWEGRSHFFGVAARLMRQVLVDSARRFRAAKRDGGHRVTLDEQLGLAGGTAEEFLALNAAIEKLEAWDPRKAKVIELRYFGGLQREEIAEALGTSLSTVKRDLSIAEAFLRRELASR